MTVKQAQRRLDKADDALRMAGVSNLGMSAIYQRPEKHIRKLHHALYDYTEAMDAVKMAKQQELKSCTKT